MDVIPPIESIQYLVDVFIEGGYAEEEDLDHLDAIHRWLRDEEAAREATFNQRVDRAVLKNVNPDYEIIRNMAGEIVSHLSPGWETESRPFENPAEMTANRDSDEAPDPEAPAENRARYVIEDGDGNTYYFTP